MKRSVFEALIRQAVDGLPAAVRSRIKNVAFVVEERPLPRHAKVRRGGGYLLGLYEGVPLSAWGRDYHMMPDIITIFQEPIEAVASTPDEIPNIVRDTVWHEVGHYLGLDDKKLRALEKKWRSARYPKNRNA